jgi:hypothetical protein
MESIMPFDLNILCLNETKKIKSFPFSSIFTFEVKHRGKDSYPKYYGHYWHFMSHCQGFWYYLKPIDSLFGPNSCCYDLCNIFYDKKKLKIENEQYYDGEQHYKNLWQYIDFLPVFGIKPEFRKDFEIIIDFFLDQSPIKTIIFLPRFQGEEKDVIQGIFSYKEFFEMLDSKQIKFNMCYIIRKNDDKSDIFVSS